MKSDLIEAVANRAEAETRSRPSVTEGAPGFPVTGMKRAKTIRGKVWTPEEDAYLKANLGIIPLKEIGRALGRTEGAVHLRWERDLHLQSPRRNRNWLTLEAFSIGLGIDGHSVIKLVDGGKLTARWLPSTIRRTDGRRGIRVIDCKDALAWIADPMHWVYFKPERVGAFRKQGQRGMAKPDVIFWRAARAALDELKRTWKDSWLTPGQTGHLIGVRHGINRAINLGILKAVRWGNWWILRSEALRFARERVSDNWGPRKIKRIRFRTA